MPVVGRGPAGTDLLCLLAQPELQPAAVACFWLRYLCSRGVGDLAGTACLQWLDNVQPAASREEMLYPHGAPHSCFGCCSSMPTHGSRGDLGGMQLRVASQRCCHMNNFISILSTTDLNCPGWYRIVLCVGLQRKKSRDIHVGVCKGRECPNTRTPLLFSSAANPP